MTIFHSDKDWIKFIHFMERVIGKYNCRSRGAGPEFNNIPLHSKLIIPSIPALAK